MNFINTAFAAEENTAATTTSTSTEVPTEAGLPEGAAGDALMMNIGMVVLMGVMFYLLLIRPQQKRYKEHNEMLKKLDKGSKVITQGGLIGVIEKVVSDHEVVVDFGNGVKMNVMRSYVLGRYEDSLPTQVANDVSKKKDAQRS
jgi:preprotein translocase subunit YajC